MEGSPRLTCLYRAAAVTQHCCVSPTPIENAAKIPYKSNKCKIEALLRLGFLVAKEFKRLNTK